MLAGLREGRFHAEADPKDDISPRGFEPAEKMIKIGSFDAAALDDVLGSQFVFFHSLVQIMAEDGCLHFVLPDICHLRELSGFLDDGQELGGGQLSPTMICEICLKITVVIH